LQEGHKLASVLKSPSNELGPGKSASLPTAAKQSSYNREGEGTLLAALFEGGCEDPRREVIRVLQIYELFS